MDDDFEDETLRDFAATEERISAECRAPYEQKPYRRVFCSLPDGELHPYKEFPKDYLFQDGYFESAKRLLEGIVASHEREAIYGAAAVFLARHYLELAIKFTLFHSRWLKSESENAQAVDIAMVERTHDLQHLWGTLASELQKKAGLVPAGLDLDFVREFVKEFHSIDSRNWRFRYPCEQLPANSSSQYGFRIDFAALLFDLQRVFEVLQILDSCLLLTFGENEEWEAERHSW